MNNQNESKPASDAMEAKVTGIGGIFFYADNTQEAKDWYSKNLGLEFNAWGGCGFESRDLQQPDRIHNLQWCTFKSADAYFAPSQKPFMINYRVQHIEALVEKLRANGVSILDDIATYDYGKFVHIMDHEGNKIELWEPA